MIMPYIFLGESFFSGCLKKGTVIASLATQGVRNLPTTKNGNAKTFSGSPYRHCEPTDIR